MKIYLKAAKQYTLAFCLIGVLVMLSNTAFAQNQENAIVDVLCKVVALLQGTMGKAIATIGLIVLGIGLFLGKLNWPLALATAIGIGIIFGAPTVVNYIAPGASGFNCPIQ